MPVVTPEKLVALQRNAEDVRNICILAHVDHGKTSLTDALIATNGIISPKMAGKIRYLDSRPDEQLRGITMESSAISLCFSMARRSSPEAEPAQKDYLINLIDSPGHVDFSSEVSTASRLCDGAVVLVDAVEGVCSQTVTVLRQTWIECLKPVLVVNKIDRLITELKMTANEAYIHLSKLLEQVNAVLGSFFQGERMEEDLQWREKMEHRVNAAAVKSQAEQNTEASEFPDTMDNISDSGTGAFEERDDEDLYFAPENNNVIFSSAVDGWAFTVRQFSRLYEKRLGIKRSVLEKVLWGDYYLDPKTKRVLGSKHLKGRSLKPMFVQLVLDNIWAVYDATSSESKMKGDGNMIEKITRSLGITIPPHIMRSKDPRALLTTIFSSWLPLSTALLVSVIEQLPSPPVAQASRIPALLDGSPGANRIDQTVRNAMTTFKTSPEDPVVAYVSKMVSVPGSELPQNKRKAGAAMTPEEARELARKKRAEIAKAQATADSETNGANGILDSFANANLNNHAEQNEPEVVEEPEQLIGFARLYSGTLTVGDSVYVLAPKFSPENPHARPEPQKVEVTALYLLMGRSLESLTSVPAGVVFGIGGLEGHILKTGTLCSQLEGSVNLAGVSMGGEPIVRVALEPANPADFEKMKEGLKLLEQSDPCARFEVLENGEYVILGAGELHLERCLKDLRERFARCEIQAGEPIVPYRESIVNAAEMAAPKNKELARGTVVGVTGSKQVAIRLRVRPLPADLTDFLTRKTDDLQRLYAKKKAAEDTQKGLEESEDGALEDATIENVVGRATMSMLDFKGALKESIEEIKEDRGFWSDAIEHITAFGPRRVGPNLLIDATKEKICGKFLQETTGAESTASEVDPTSTSLIPADFSDRIGHAFQLAMAQGPLCNEPVQGIAVFIEDVNVTISPEESTHHTSTTSHENLGRLTSEVIRIVRSSIHTGFQDWSPRLLLAMYSCEIQASTEVLGRVYGVITRRRGHIVSEAVKEGTPFFTVTALLPVAESFGFSDEIRKRTSGAASPQLRFQGFEMLDEDPFWVPFTEDELEDLGELADKENVAKRYMDRVRRRKGLVVKGAKRVEAEKQRTLKR